jgi:hypothetical protein
MGGKQPLPPPRRDPLDARGGLLGGLLGPRRNLHGAQADVGDQRQPDPAGVGILAARLGHRAWVLCIGQYQTMLGLRRYGGSSAASASIFQRHSFNNRCSH